MKTTKRSKMLLSSIAMLLVALVALGSATYAWYVVNQTVTASSVTVSAAAAQGLVISKNGTSDWKSAINLNNTKNNLTPVSLNLSASGLTYDTTTAVTADGKDVDDGEFKTGTSTAVGHDNLVSSSNTYAVVDDFYIKASSGTINNVKLQVTGDSVAGTYMNFAVYYDGNYVGAACSTGNSGAEAGVDRVNNGAKFAITGLNTDMYTISSVTTDAKRVQVIAYVDGENANCKNITASESAMAFGVKAYYQ